MRSEVDQNVLKGKQVVYRLYPSGRIMYRGRRSEWKWYPLPATRKKRPPRWDDIQWMVYRMLDHACLRYYPQLRCILGRSTMVKVKHSYCEGLSTNVVQVTGKELAKYLVDLVAKDVILASEVRRQELARSRRRPC